MIPLVKLIPGMSHTPETAARRYLQASEFHQQRICRLWRTLVIAIGCTLPLFGCSTGLPTTEDPRVLPVYHSDRIWNGVATTREGQVFACYPSIEGLGPQLEQLKPQDVAVPWPNDAWNSWKPGNDFAGEFVHINAIRTGPGGILWAVDAGAPGFGQPAIHGAARLIGFDTSTGQLERVYSLSAGAKPTRSGLDIQDVDRSKASNQRSSLNVVLHRLAQPNPND